MPRATLRLDAALSDAKAGVREVNLMEEPELDAELPRALAGGRTKPADGADRFVGAIPARHAAYSPIRDIGPRLDILGRAQP